MRHLEFGDPLFRDPGVEDLQGFQPCHCLQHFEVVDPGVIELQHFKVTEVLKVFQVFHRCASEFQRFQVAKVLDRHQVLHLGVSDQLPVATHVPLQARRPLTFA